MKLTCWTRLLLPLAILVPNAQAQTVPAWKLELAQTIRPPEGSPGIIGNVIGIVVTDDGAVYVAEQTPARITRYDSKGNFVRVVVREGSGPKEARRPGIALQGDTLLVYDPMAMRLSRIAPDDRLLSERPVEVNAIGFPIWTTAAGHIILDDPGSGPGYNDGALRLAPNGTVDTVRWFRSNVDNVVKKDLIPTTLPPWVTFDINPRGEWWIGRPATNGALGSWDIVDNGRVVGHVAVPQRVMDIRGRSGRAFGRNFVALMHEDENDVPWIGVYRIVRTQR